MGRTTIPLTERNGQDMAPKKQEGPVQDKPAAWNMLGAKPKEKKQRITGRTLSPEITDLTGWPALPLRHNASSTPQQWTTAKGKKADKLLQSPCIQLANRYTPLLEDPRCVSDDRGTISPSWLSEQLREPRSLSQDRVTPSRVRSTSKSIQPQGESAPEILIVGDAALKDVKCIRQRKAKVLCFPKDTVSDINDRILDLVDAHPTVKTLILHTGTCDTEEKQSEILKRKFTALLSTLTSLSDINVCISGPLPPMRGTDENFSRLLSLSKWLSATCTNKNVQFIDNFRFFWDRRHLFEAKKLNKLGVRLFTQNVFHSVITPPASAKASTDVPKTIDYDCTEAKTSTLNSKTRTSVQPLSGSTESTAEVVGGCKVTAPPAMELSDSDFTEEEQMADGTKTTDSDCTKAKSDLSQDDVREDFSEVGVRQEVGVIEDFGEVDVRQEVGVREDFGEVDAREDFSEVDAAEVTGTEEEETPSPHSSSFSLSPMPLLQFTSCMNDLINTGIKMTPVIRRPAPQPPTLPQKSVAWVLSPPPIPPRRRKGKNTVPASQPDTTFNN